MPCTTTFGLCSANKANLSPPLPLDRPSQPYETSFLAIDLACLETAYPMSIESEHSLCTLPVG